MTSEEGRVPQEPTPDMTPQSGASAGAEPSASIGAELWERSAQLIRDGSRFGGEDGDREFGCGMQEVLRALGIPKP